MNRSCCAPAEEFLADIDGHTGADIDRLAQDIATVCQQMRIEIDERKERGLFEPEAKVTA